MPKYFCRRCRYKFTVRRVNLRWPGVHWTALPACQMARQGGQESPHCPGTTSQRPQVMRRRPSVPASRGLWNWMREPITELRECSEPYEKQLKRREPHLLQLRVDCHGHVGVEGKLETAAHCGSTLLRSPDCRLAPESEASVCSRGHSLTCPITGAIGSPACRHIETATEDDSCGVLAAESR
jgi:hypothetical protein